jgi:ribonuclease Z
MRVVFLGTGGTYPCTERNVMAIAVQIGKEVLLLDCGEGTQRQFMKSNVSFMSTRWIFITHYHGDHFLGLPGLIQSMNLNDRKRQLDIYGPTGTVDLMQFLLSAGHFAAGYEIVSHDVEPGDEVQLEGFSVAVEKADHTVPSLAYAVIEEESPGRFDTEKAAKLGIPEGPLFRRLQKGESIDVEGRRIKPDQVLGPSRKGRKVVYTGDTRPSKKIIKLAADADLLIHDATLLSSEGGVASDFGHSTCEEAAEVAKAAGAKALALVHYSPRYKEHQALIDEAKSIFPNVFAPSDLEEFVVKRTQR